MIGFRVNNFYNECLDSMSIYQLFGLIGYKDIKNQPITLSNNVISCLDFICQRSILKDNDRASLREFKLSKMIFSSCTIQEKSVYKYLTGNSLKDDFDNMDSYISHDGYVRIFIVKDKDSFANDGKFWIEAYNIYNFDNASIIPECNAYSIFIPEKFNIESNFISFLFEFCEIYLHHASLIKHGIKVKKESHNGREVIHLNFNDSTNPEHRILSIQQSLFIYYYYATVFRMMKQIIPDISEEDISQLSLNTNFKYIFSKIFKDAIVNGKYLNYNTDSSDNVDPDTIVDISRAFIDSTDN